MLSVLRNPKLFCGQTTQRMTLRLIDLNSKPNQTSIQTTMIRLFGESRSGGRVNTHAFRRIELKKQTLKERLLSPTTGLPFNIGKGVVAGSALFGIGALCYYGMGLSQGTGIYERSMVWDQYVRDRIHTTYAYLGSGLGITAAAAVSAFRSPTMLRLMSRNSFMALLLTMGAMIGTGVVAQSIPYKEGFGAKQIAWAVHCGVIGAVIAPLFLLGGPIMLRAAAYTAGIVGSLSAVAVCAPSDRFLNMGGPLAIGLGFVFAASIGSMFLPPTTALGASLFSISLYGGLVLFSAFLLYDTQRIVRKAETHPRYSERPFDPINSSISIYMDVINIFVRIVTMLAMGGGGKRR